MLIDFVDLAHQSPGPAEFEAGVLDRLGRAVGFDAAFFLTKGSATEPISIGLDRKTVAHLTTHSAAYAQELLPVQRAALTARGVAVDTEVCGVLEVRQMRYFLEIAATVRGQHSLMAYVPWGNNTIAAVMLGRSRRGFSAEEQRRMESVLPSLGVARAAFGLPPWAPAPLQQPGPASLLSRLRLSPRVLAAVPSNGGHLVVRDQAGFREMVAQSGASELVWTRALLRDPRQSGWPYADLFHLAPALAKQRSRALFIGCGGGVSLHQFACAYPAMAIDVVEVEPAVISLARTWFDLDNIPNLTVHQSEGAAFIQRAMPSSWDVVIVDAFDATACAETIRRQAFLTDLQRVLTPGGAAAFNLIGSLDQSRGISAFVSAARGTFDSLRVVPVLDLYEDYAPDTLRNLVVIASRDA